MAPRTEVARQRGGEWWQWQRERKRCDCSNAGGRDGKDAGIAVAGVGVDCATAQKGGEDGGSRRVAHVGQNIRTGVDVRWDASADRRRCRGIGKCKRKRKWERGWRADG